MSTLPERLPDPMAATYGVSSPRRQAFIGHYLLTGNGVVAAERSGYANPANAAMTLLRDPDVRAAIADAQGERARRVNITADRVLRELVYVGLSNIAHYTVDPETGIVEPAPDVGPQVMRAIKSIKFTRRVERRRDWSEGAPETAMIEDTITETQLTLWDKNTALRSLMDHLGMHAPKNVNINTKGDITVHDLRDAIVSTGNPAALAHLPRENEVQADYEFQNPAAPPDDPAFAARLHLSQGKPPRTTEAIGDDAWLVRYRDVLTVVRKDVDASDDAQRPFVATLPIQPPLQIRGVDLEDIEEAVVRAIDATVPAP